MKRILNYCILFCIILSCKKDIPNTGIIIREITELKCVEFINDTSFAIQSDQAYDQFKLKVKSRPCLDFPTIDFNQYAILFQNNVIGCNDKVYLQVNDIPSNKVYEYKLFVKDKRCRNKVGVIVKSFVLVPKLPVGYTVEYKKEKL